MPQIKIYVTLNVDDRYIGGTMCEETFEYIKEKIQEIADGVEGSVEDLEIK